MNIEKLTIGKIAREASVNVETVRYYQRIGLVTEPVKPMYGFRYYPPETIERIRFIKRAQQLGFSLKDIEDLLALGDGHCKDVEKLAQEKHDQILVQIKDLTRLKKVLGTLIKDCQENKPGSNCCPIVKTISDAI